eukprot:2335347-Rhodomonas_salina.3
MQCDSQDSAKRIRRPGEGDWTSARQQHEHWEGAWCVVGAAQSRVWCGKDCVSFGHRRADEEANKGESDPATHTRLENSSSDSTRIVRTGHHSM